MSHILAIETSCDETAAAVLKDGRKVLSSIVGFQWDIHRKYGGVVPELACRRHIEIIQPLTEEALKKGGIDLKDLDAIAVTSCPGLIGSLLVGVSFAKALSYSLKIPLIPVNHLEGHLWAISLERRVPRPFIALVVSGGHTNLYIVEDVGKYTLLGSTLDDAAGEAFDKVARILGLGFPGGPAIELYGMNGNPDAVAFPRALLNREGFDFSFSGIKTAVVSYVRGIYKVAHIDDIPGAIAENDQFKADIAASFQQAVVDVLVTRTIGSARKAGIRRIVISGGVACNKLLRSRMKSDAAANGITVYIPSPQYCTDNAAMIAWVGYRYFKKGISADLRLNPSAGGNIG